MLYGIYIASFTLPFSTKLVSYTIEETFDILMDIEKKKNVNPFQALLNKYKKEYKFFNRFIEK